MSRRVRRQLFPGADAAGGSGRLDNISATQPRERPTQALRFGKNIPKSLKNQAKRFGIRLTTGKVGNRKKKSEKVLRQQVIRAKILRRRKIEEKKRVVRKRPYKSRSKRPTFGVSVVDPDTKEFKLKQLQQHYKEVNEAQKKLEAEQGLYPALAGINYIKKTLGINKNKVKFGGQRRR